MKEESEFWGIEEIKKKSVAFIVDKVKLHNIAFQPQDWTRVGQAWPPSLRQRRENPSLPHQAPHNEGRAAPRDIEKSFES